MAVTLTTPLRNRLADQLQAAFGGGVLEIRSGARPAAAGDAPAGTLLASINLPAQAFAAGAGGQVAKAGVWQDLAADAAGVATWARFRKAGDAGTTNAVDERLDVSVGMAGSGADLILDNTNVAPGQAVTINTFTFTMPAQ
jgi:hypothetical protein